MKNKLLVYLIVLIMLITSSLSYAAPYPMTNADKPKVRVTLTLPTFTPAGDYIYKGVDVALYGAKIGTNTYTLYSNKAQRILTDKTKIELDFTNTNLDFTYKYKIGYRILLGKAGTNADTLFVAGENNGKDGWAIAKNGTADLIFRVDNENPTHKSITITGTGVYNVPSSSNYWIKKDGQATIAIVGNDKPSGILETFLKIGSVESLFNADTSLRSNLATHSTSYQIVSGILSSNNATTKDKTFTWGVKGLGNTALSDIYIKHTDYSTNTSGYINTGYKLGVDNSTLTPLITISEDPEYPNDPYTRKIVTITGRDSESGIKNIRYSINGVNQTTQNKTSHSFKLNLYDYKTAANNLIIIKASTEDNVGNVSGETQSSIIVNFPPIITLNRPTGGYEYKYLEKPSFNATFRDDNEEQMTVTFSINGDTQTFTNINNGEVKEFTIPDTIWDNLLYNTEHVVKITASDGKVTTERNYPLMKINTPSEINVKKPVDGQYLYQGYINFEWDILEPDNQGFGNANLTIYTDTPNTLNNGLIYSGSVAHGPGSYEAFYYLPEGVHNIYFEITDNKSAVFRKSIKVKIDKLVNININNGAKTFYISNFDEEKSNIYYSDINNRLTDSIYMLNILGDNGTLNEGYINKIKNIANVTAQPDYLNKGDRIYTKDDIDSLKITDWILEKVNKDFSINKVVKVTDILNIENIVFEDDEKDYTSTEPDRGKNRRFQVFHIPTYYENPDMEVVGNGDWVLDENFSKFDGQDVIRSEESISLKINKAGKYILNILEDDEIKNNYGKDYSKTSPDIDYVFYAHRPPKAVIRYEENGDGTIKLISEDSYDPDFMTSKPNKGINEVFWEYRELTYTNDMVTDWTEVPSINSFSVDPTYKTYLRLTVRDYGGLHDADNVLALEGSDTLVFDKTGLPPKANFDVNVGKTLEGSIYSKNIIYKGKDGAETIQLVDKTLWNDFFAESGTRAYNFTKNAATLNNDVKNNIKNLSTTLNVTNKFNLKDSITQNALVKDIVLKTPTINTVNLQDYPNLPSSLLGKIIAGSNAEFKVLLDSSLSVDWVDMKVTIQSSDLGIVNERELTHISTNLFSERFKLSNKETNSYIIRVYSRRTSEKLIEESFNLTLESYLSIDAVLNPTKDLFPGTEVNITNIITNSALNVTTVKLELHDSTKKLIDVGAINIQIAKDRDKTTWKDYLMYKLPSNLIQGDYYIKVIATDVLGNNAEKNLYFNVINVELQDFRITKVYDIRWADDGLYPIYESAMPVRTRDGNRIKVGYKVDFEIDTFGLNGVDDQLFIDVSFENYLGQTVNPRYKTNSNILTIINNEYSSIGRPESREQIMRNRWDLNNATWRFSYFIPATATKDINSNISDLYVKFIITGQKKDAEPVIYNDKYSFDGLTFIYNLENSALEDYYIRGGN